MLRICFRFSVYEIRFLASLVAVFGEFDISGDLEKKRSVTKNVKRIVVHREYDAATFENDLALLEMESPIHYDTHIGKHFHNYCLLSYRRNSTCRFERCNLTSIYFNSHSYVIFQFRFVCQRMLQILLGAWRP